MKMLQEKNCLCLECDHKYTCIFDDKEVCVPYVAISSTWQVEEDSPDGDINLTTEVDLFKSYQHANTYLKDVYSSIPKIYIIKYVENKYLFWYYRPYHKSMLTEYCQIELQSLKYRR